MANRDMDVRSFHVIGYRRRSDGRKDDSRDVAQRGIAITDGAEAERIRDEAEQERPDLIWAVEWRLRV